MKIKCYHLFEAILKIIFSRRWTPMNADKFKDTLAMEKTAKTAISRKSRLFLSLNSGNRVGFTSAFIGVYRRQITVRDF